MNEWTNELNKHSQETNIVEMHDICNIAGSIF